MSSKQTNKKGNVDSSDSRIGAKEMIITRRKSALQKRQLRNKDRSMKSITQLLKGPPKLPSVPTVKPSPKKVKDIDKIPQKNIKERKEKSLQVEEKEFYPNTLKRNVVPNKILLKPKYNMKVIAGTNKRKMCTPHRGQKSPTPFKRPKQRVSRNKYGPKTQTEECQSPVYSNLSMAEVIQMAEETHSLDDEDLMEILTCPSPVWWEDPPDSGFDEDAIFNRCSQKFENKVSEDKIIHDDLQPINNEVKPRDNSTDEQIGLNINVDNRDNKFKLKRSKLENLLGSIKKKILGCDSVNPITNIKAKLSPQLNVNRSNVSESTEEEMFSDISMNEDEVLKDLESMDIPIESNFAIKSELENIVKEESNIQVPKNMPQLKRCPTKVKKISTDVETLSSDFDSISDTNVRFIEEDEASKTSDSSPNSKSRKRNVKSKRKSKERKDETEVNTVIVSKSIDKELVSDLGLNHNADIEYITVYKIMSNRNDSPKKAGNLTENEHQKQKDTSTKKTNVQITEIDNKRNLNLFFKKCKDNRRNKKNKSQTGLNTEDNSITSDKELDKNSKLVSENNQVKYCYKCSSIFDTDECSYCKRKSNIEPKACLSNKQCSCSEVDQCTEKGQCLCDKTCEILSCNLCNFQTDTKFVLNEHLLVHNSNKGIETVNNNCIKPDENQV